MAPKIFSTVAPPHHNYFFMMRVHLHRPMHMLIKWLNVFLSFCSKVKLGYISGCQGSFRYICWLKTGVLSRDVSWAYVAALLHLTVFPADQVGDSELPLSIKSCKPSTYQSDFSSIGRLSSSTVYVSVFLWVLFTLANLCLLAVADRWKWIMVRNQYRYIILWHNMII